MRGTVATAPEHAGAVRWAKSRAGRHERRIAQWLVPRAGQGSRFLIQRAPPTGLHVNEGLTALACGLPEPVPLARQPPPDTQEKRHESGVRTARRPACIAAPRRPLISWAGVRRTAARSRPRGATRQEGCPARHLGVHCVAMSDATPRPDRWLHVRLPRPLTDAEWELFCAETRVFRAYVEATLAVWPSLGFGHEAPAYRFFAPELSTDRTVATLPLGGAWTLASRALFESGAAYMLWERFPAETQALVEEGLTEEHDGTPETHWRAARRLELPHPESHTEALDDAHEHPSVLDTARRALWWVSGILPRG